MLYLMVSAKNRLVLGDPEVSRPVSEASSYMFFRPGWEGMEEEGQMRFAKYWK